MIVKGRIDRLWLRHRGLVFSCLVAVFAIGSALPFSVLDFDPHHDGVMLATAIAVRDGGVVHRDVFAQYGPVAPLIQGYGLLIFGDAAVGIRIINVIAIGVVAFALAEAGRHGPTYWPVSPSAGRAAALAWIVLADYFLGVPQLPWSSVFAAALSCLLVLAFASALKQLEVGRVERTYWLSGVAGVLIALLPFTRVNVGVATVAVMLPLALCSYILITTVRGPMAILGASWLGGTSLIVATLAFTGGLVPWWEQSILWPLAWSADVDFGQSPMSLSLLVLSNMWPFIVGIALAALANIFADLGSLRARRLSLGLSVVVGTALVVFLFYAQASQRLHFAFPLFDLGQPVASLARSSFTFLTFLPFVVPVLSLMLLARSVIFTDVAHRSLGVMSTFMLVGLALAGLVQFFPVPDSRHIWWSLPIALLVVFAAFGRVRSWLPTRNPLVPSFMAIVVVAVLTSHSYLGVDRSIAPAGSVYSNMKMTGSTLEKLESGRKVFQETIGDSKALFLVDDGVWSVVDGTYRSISPQFVAWGPGSDNLSALLGAPWVVLDARSRTIAESVLRNSGFYLVETSGDLDIWRRE